MRGCVVKAVAFALSMLCGSESDGEEAKPSRTRLAARLRDANGRLGCFMVALIWATALSTSSEGAAAAGCTPTWDSALRAGVSPHLGRTVADVSPFGLDVNQENTGRRSGQHTTGKPVLVSLASTDGLISVHPSLIG
jgi:hypothetical protein